MLSLISTFKNPTDLIAAKSLAEKHLLNGILPKPIEDSSLILSSHMKQLNLTKTLSDITKSTNASPNKTFFGLLTKEEFFSLSSASDWKVSHSLSPTNLYNHKN